MKKKHLSDVFPTDTGVFQALNSIETLPWAEIVTPATMDVVFMDMYGEKPISGLTSRLLGDSETLTAENLQRLAQSINVMYRHKWERLYEELTYSYPILANFSETIKEITTGKTTDTGTVNTSGDSVNQISAFNSSDFVDNTKDTDGNKEERDLSGTSDTTREYTRTGYNGDVANLLNNAITLLQNYLLYDIIFTDASSVIASHIYD